VTLTVKEKKPGQRACDEKDAKGKLCLGHLKRWYTPSGEVAKLVTRNAEIYRCERCHTLYQPAPNDKSSAGRNYNDREVNLLGWAVHPSKD
jgi:hypothetical protein